MRVVLAAVLVAGATALVAGQAASPRPATPSAAPKPVPAKPVTAAGPNRLLSPATLTAKAPDDFKVKFDTTKGPMLLELHRMWSPRGVDRFYNMVRNGDRKSVV